MARAQNILMIHLEFAGWNIAKSWSYETQLGINDGLKCCGVNVLTCITINTDKVSLHQNWFKSVKAVIGNRTFDQVWMEVVHSQICPQFLEYLEGLAPVRLAMVGESLLYTEEEYSYAPTLRSRYEMVKNRLKHFTHVLCCDEEDVGRIERDCGLKCLWSVVGVPGWSISSAIDEPLYDKASFSGPVYGKRSALLRDSGLSPYLLQLPPLEKNTLLPLLFDCVQNLYKGVLAASPLLAASRNNHYVRAIQMIRLRLFMLWIQGLKRGIAVVQLPHFVKAFPGRIYEGMAAGRPVITMTIQDRPKAMMLFEPGKEILYYDEGPEELAELIRMLQLDRLYAKRLAENAALKMKSLHTIEHRVKQILRWIDAGELPEYS